METSFNKNRIELYKSRIKAEAKIIDSINKYNTIIGKESGINKLYFLENGNVIYAKYSSLRQKKSEILITYSFSVNIDRFEEYKEKNLILTLTCGSSEKTLIIPSEDTEKLLKHVNISSHNRWQFHILPNMEFAPDRTTNLSKYLNKWEFINRHEIKTNKAMDNIKLSELRTKIFEYISKLSKENKKCNHNYLCNNLYSENYSKYDILYSLKYLEEKGAIYKIPYVDWYVKENYKEKDIEDDNKLLIYIFKIIKNYSKNTNWKYGIKKSDLFEKLLEKGYSESEIRDTLKLLEERKIIFKKTFIYWFTKDYKDEVIKGDFLESKDKDIIYMPDKSEKIEEKVIEKEKIDQEFKIEMVEEEEDIEDHKEDTEEKQEFDPSKIEFLIKKWRELKAEEEKVKEDINKEIVEQKELERKREESIQRQNQLETRIIDIDKQRNLLEKNFKPIMTIYTQFERVDEEKKMKLLVPISKVK